MSNKDEALKMAIEALENIAFEYGQLLDGDQDYGLLPSETNEDIVIAYRVKRACKEALGQEEVGDAEIKQMLNDIEYYQKRVEALEQPMINGLTESETNQTMSVKGLSEQPAQEPVSDHEQFMNEARKSFGIAPSWQGLSDGDVMKIVWDLEHITDKDLFVVEFYRAIEAKLKEKNHD